MQADWNPSGRFGISERNGVSEKTSLKAHDVIPAIDVDRLTGNAAASWRAEEQRCVGDLLHIHVALEWRVLGVVLEHVAKVAHAARGQGHNRPGGDGVDADLFGADAVGQVTHTCFQRSFGYAHHVVSRDDFFRAEISESDDA